MISLILMQKILSLFIILFLGFFLVKIGVIKPEDSKALSTVSIYLVTPCMILAAFEVDLTPDVRQGVILAFAAAILIHVILFIVFIPLERILHLNPVEKLSVFYSNAGNLVIPLVTSLFGAEWVIYSCAFVSVQLFFLWSHGKAVLCGDKGLDLKKIFTNINMISVLLGIVILLTGFRFVTPVQDAIDSLKSMIGPLAMLVTGILIGNKKLSDITAYKRVWMVAALRLIGIPLLMLGVLKFSPLHTFAENGTTILMISLLATITPSASSITQMSVVYGQDADYASAINVVTTLGCIITMPIMIFLYQL